MRNRQNAGAKRPGICPLVMSATSNSSRKSCVAMRPQGKSWAKTPPRDVPLGKSGVPMPIDEEECSFRLLVEIRSEVVCDQTYAIGVLSLLTVKG